MELVGDNTSKGVGNRNKMSLLFLGKTRCPICKNIINEEDDYYGFSAFVVNIIDPLYFFSDGSFHLECLTNSKHGEKAMKYADLGNLKFILRIEMYSNWRTYYQTTGTYFNWLFNL